jgi:hypothetical protein
VAGGMGKEEVASPGNNSGNGGKRKDLVQERRR